jgi:hypothetical protein
VIGREEVGEAHLPAEPLWQAGEGIADHPRRVLLVGVVAAAYVEQPVVALHGRGGFEQSEVAGLQLLGRGLALPAHHQHVEVGAVDELQKIRGQEDRQGHGGNRRYRAEQNQNQSRIKQARAVGCPMAPLQSVASGSDLRQHAVLDVLRRHVAEALALGFLVIGEVALEPDHF